MRLENGGEGLRGGHGVVTGGWLSKHGWLMRWMLFSLIASGVACDAMAQIDPRPRSLLHLGYDQSISGDGPQSGYAYYYCNKPEFFRKNMALRLAVAPVFFDGELGFRGVLSPNTDIGLGIRGGGFADNYFEIRQGEYLRRESFTGHGGGASVSMYHLFNPLQLVPLHLVVQGGAQYSTYARTRRTDGPFQPPRGRPTSFSRAGLRFAGKEPMLYPDLAMEVSVWLEHRWQFDDSPYGFSGDRKAQRDTGLYWLYAGMSYASTNTGNQFTLAVTAGGASRADRFTAWRLGGVLPLAAEFSLALPGYLYQELSAKHFVHLGATYVAPVSANHRWQFRFTVASAMVDYLSGLEQPGHWHTGVGAGLSFTSERGLWRVILAYGYGVNALRNGREGGQSLGLLIQRNLERRINF